MPHAKAAKFAKRKEGFQIRILCELCTAIARIRAVSERFFTTDFTDFTDGKWILIIREIREIRG
jgi:hypothetical protein